MHSYKQVCQIHHHETHQEVTCYLKNSRGKLQLDAVEIRRDSNRVPGICIDDSGNQGGELRSRQLLAQKLPIRSTNFSCFRTRSNCSKSFDAWVSGKHSITGNCTFVGNAPPRYLRPQRKVLYTTGRAIDTPGVCCGVKLQGVWSRRKTIDTALQVARRISGYKINPLASRTGSCSSQK